MFLIGLAILFYVGFYFIRKDLQQVAFIGLEPITQQLQKQLNGGTSPNGTLSNTFYGSYEASLTRELQDVLKEHRSDSASFGIVQEETKSYNASSVRIDGQVLIPPAKFIAKTKAAGSSQSIWQPSTGTWVAIHSLGYHYGNINGFVIAGKSAKAYVVKLAAYGLALILIWSLIAVLSYKSILKPDSNKK